MPKKSDKHGIMDAVSALTTLGDEESGSESGEAKQSPEKKSSDDSKPAAKKSSSDGETKPRYIPEHKKPDAALTFPEKLMNMMHYADDFKDDEKFCIAWIPDGKSFVIRNPDTFTRQVLPKFFKATKFQSFTRKLYRWGFRQVNRGIGPDDPIIFGNEYFQRDDEELMVKMRSTTAASNRRSRTDPLSGRKRSLEELDQERKMILLDRLMAEKAAMGGDPRYMAQYMGGFRFPPGMPPMMMQRFGGMPGMMPFMQPPNQEGEGGEGGDAPQDGEGGGGGEQQEEEAGGGDKPSTPQQQQGEQEIINSAVAALRYAA